MVARQSPRARRLLAALGSLVLLTATATAAGAAGGFKTAIPSMITPASGVSAEAIISVGDTVGSYRFESIPDGIALRGAAGGYDVWVNHETSTVPFPYNPAAPTEANSQNDFDNAQLSHLLIDPTDATVTSASMVIDSADNFQRFCSNYLATAAEGFDRPLLFTNEEGIDWVNREGKAWPAVIGDDAARQVGVVVAYDPASDAHRPIWGMGRFNHENSVAVPGFRKVVLLSGDDTFTNNPSQSQLYSYIAKDSSAVWNDSGRLYAFVSDDPAYQRYEDFAPGDTATVSGKFIPVPKLIAEGRNPDGTELMAADVPIELGGPYPLPPDDGTWQRDPSGKGVDGPQWVLEKWSQLNGAFRFIRVEDLAYDKRPGKGNIVYVVDSGRGSSGTVADGKSTNGRVFQLVLDPKNERKVTSMSVYVEGDDREVKDPDRTHQPDNIETTAAGIYLTEDPGSSQQFPFGSTDTRATTARIWQYPFAGTARVIASVNQSLDEMAGYDVDSAAAGNLGAWESSGIVDASAAFGPGAFLVTVQAHTLWVEKAAGDDNFAPTGADFTYKREGGQLVLIRVAGG